ncbi:Unknown protein sequence [Pseudomonas cannabina pv. alisalensis]|uniref:Uncharacterized protein n=2 Tax=Pseudomonas cannabina TaxID=86840 RepID=A0A3M3S6E3_PSECA|nr:Unknown protein sequence [Pseudomonas cannabina pv. alisalensis]RMN75459.1 hypothetical protein ALQ52_02228 [Pseudomonas cannabina pv. alisalensis]RMO04266.1 hypothetical protein ALQ51_03906 [Pseudomonas cannabina]
MSTPYQACASPGRLSLVDSSAPLLHALQPVTLQPGSAHLCTDDSLLSANSVSLCARPKRLPGSFLTPQNSLS